MNDLQNWAFMVRIKDIISHLESFAPPAFQESYDNSGLLTGNISDEVKGLLITLDVTEEVVAEAIKNGDNLIIAHHPIIFSGLKSLTGKNYVERTVIKAIKNDIAIYAIHTNLDNVYLGVNKMISDKIGLINTNILAPKTHLLTKLTTFVPTKDSERVKQALFDSGAGNIGNYYGCSFSVTGKGQFTPNEIANPAIGSASKKETVSEERIEVVLPNYMSDSVLNALKTSHPYEEVAYYLTPLQNAHQQVGSGMIGEIKESMDAIEFLKELKLRMNLNYLKHTPLVKHKIKKVAICGGSGSFLLKSAIKQDADIYISADFKYHEYFDAEDKIIIADIGHYESEVFTKDLLYDILSEKFHTFALNLSKTVTNPISYL